MQEKKYHKIAVLSGGISAEREVSIISAKNCYDALKRCGYTPHLIDPIEKNWVREILDLNPDAVLNMLHGRHGEDGEIQGFLESIKVPYSHSGVTSSAICMDKTASKVILADHGIPIVKSIESSPQTILKRIKEIGFPCVLKPVREGSSIAIFILENEQQISPELLEHDTDYRKFMLEKYIKGKELTVSVLNDRPLGVTEISPKKGDFFDYDSKYSKDGAIHHIPANIPKDIYDKVMEYALKAHRVLGCRGVSRSDFLYSDSDSHGIIFLEINTQPGMTPLSLVPEQAAYCGIDYDELVKTLIEDASCRR